MITSAHDDNWLSFAARHHIVAVASITTPPPGLWFASGTGGGEEEGQSAGGAKGENAGDGDGGEGGFLLWFPGFSHSTLYGTCDKISQYTFFYQDLRAESANVWRTPLRRRGDDIRKRRAEKRQRRFSEKRASVSLGNSVVSLIYGSQIRIYQIHVSLSLYSTSIVRVILIVISTVGRNTLVFPSNSKAYEFTKFSSSLLSGRDRQCRHAGRSNYRRSPNPFSLLSPGHR